MNPLWLVAAFCAGAGGTVGVYSASMTSELMDCYAAWEWYEIDGALPPRHCWQYLDSYAGVTIHLCGSEPQRVCSMSARLEAP